jgi:energy-coupling factor transport system ATP-binding protein
MAHEFFTGPNFSGRSAALLATLRERAGPTFFVGPYAEAALSGLSSTIADELTLYHGQPKQPRAPFSGLTAAGALTRKPQSLSGGEQVLLALHCFAQSAFDGIAVDTALEQLDAPNRAAALAHLASGTFDALLIDNRDVPAGWLQRMFTPADMSFAIDWPALTAAVQPQRAQAIAIRGLSFAYPKGRQIFRDAEVMLEPGMAHRLSGANGAGKTTLLKILVGALKPAAGEITLGGAPYRPWRDGNRALALATQNPDQQWCGATLREDLTRRRHALRETDDAALMDEARLAALARALGIASLDQHLYELPLAARKRVSWLWPLAGTRPWIMLDEPTIGQDRDTRERLARLIATACERGYGAIFVTHDDAFAAMLMHRRLHVENGAVSSRASTAE